MFSRFLWVTLVAAVGGWTCAFAQVASIDLKPYGFLPTRNPQYFPEFYSSGVAYLTDGSLVVAFRREPQLEEKAFAATRPLTAVRLLRFDAQTGKLLAKSDTNVEHGVEFLNSAPDAHVLLEGTAKFVLLDSSFREIRRFELPKEESRIDVANGAGRFAVGVPEGDKNGDDKEDKEKVEVLTLPGFQVGQHFELDADEPMALLSDGRATLNGDARREEQIVITREDGKERVARLPMKDFDCSPTMGKLPKNHIFVNVCDRFFVYDEDGIHVFDGNIPFKNTVVGIAPAAKASRFAVIMIEGAVRKPLDQQRIYGESFRVVIYDLDKLGEVGTVKVKPMPKLGGTFALSPDGKTLAALKDGVVEQVAVDRAKK